MGTGGSRYGAGRPGWRGKCEHLNRLDVRELHRKQLLRAGSAFVSSWSRDGEPSGSVSVRIDSESLNLTYQWTPSGSEPIPRTTAFRISHTRCHFGGVRPWLSCKWCGRRCAIIYGVSGDGYFACRRCLKLGYASEAEGSLDRLWRKQRKLEAKLEENYRKPKWMRRRTYDRIWAKIDEVEERKDHAFYVGAMAILMRGGMTLSDL